MAGFSFHLAPSCCPCCRASIPKSDRTSTDKWSDACTKGLMGVRAVAAGGDFGAANWFNSSPSSSLVLLHRSGELFCRSRSEGRETKTREKIEHRPVAALTERPFFGRDGGRAVRFQKTPRLRPNGVPTFLRREYRYQWHWTYPMSRRAPWHISPYHNASHRRKPAARLGNVLRHPPDSLPRTPLKHSGIGHTLCHADYLIIPHRTVTPHVAENHPHLFVFCTFGRRRHPMF